MSKWTQDEISQLEELYPVTYTDNLTDEFGRSSEAIRAKASRLGLQKHDDLDKIESIESSNKIDLSDISDERGNFLAGFVAGEGSFIRKRENGSKRFTFQVTVADDDPEAIDMLKQTLDCGTIHQYAPRRDGEKGSIVFQVSKYGDIVKKVIPFFDKYGFHRTRKNGQYREWAEVALMELPVLDDRRYQDLAINRKI
ncbi:LAGLIDADG endonuclease [Halogranum tailed virus 1]|uniref:LAGLIDADG endonuclease n=1 Tax=Halogranum tailed virus 1 TaxID=1273749 RepID=R4TMM0_9CAUD|nr:LAGLIDADG endonuclease [Halogranum tailed virus 1]AGM11403.1 LAGLIDADG endonuclease [Halogranum tailed virus 1]